MAQSRFGRFLGHLPNIFPPAPGETTQRQPDIVLGDVRPSIDVLGSSRLNSVLVTEQRLNGATTSPALAAPAAGTFNYILYSSVRHTDVVVRPLSIILIDPVSSFEVAIESTLGTVDGNAGTHLVARNYVQPPGYTLASRTDAIGGGQAMIFYTIYVNLPLGEFVRLSGT